MENMNVLSQEETHDLNKASCHEVCSSRCSANAQPAPGAAGRIHLLLTISISILRRKQDGTSKQPYIQLLIYQIPLPFSLAVCSHATGFGNTYSCPEALEIWCLQHESIEHLLRLPPHVQQDCKRETQLLTVCSQCCGLV